MCAPVTIRRPISPLARATVSSIRTSTRFLQNGPPSFSLKHATGSLPTLSLSPLLRYLSLSALLLLLLFPLVDPVFCCFSFSLFPAGHVRSLDLTTFDDTYLSALPSLCDYYRAARNDARLIESCWIVYGSIWCYSSSSSSSSSNVVWYFPLPSRHVRRIPCDISNGTDGALLQTGHHRFLPCPPSPR